MKMTTNVFSIFDSKAECFLQIFTYPAPGQAIRMFTDLCNDKNNQIGQHPDDYRLFRVGEFNDTTGEVTGSISPVCLVTGAEVVGGRDGQGLRVERA
jgi:hypothetical protein